MMKKMTINSHLLHLCKGCEMVTDKKDYHVVSLSGGKDSTAMLLGMIERGMQVDEILCCDTTVEFPQMYKHLKDLEEYIGRKITILKAKHDFEYYMLEHIKLKGKNKGKKGYGWPDFRNRWCTTLLKQNIIREYLKDISKNYNVVEYHGIAIDEKERSFKNKGVRNIIYPLIEWNMTESDCLQYCYNKGFTWDGLYEKLNRVSCYLCPLQRLGELKVIWKEYPELWNKMKNLDEQTIKLHGRKFRADYAIVELEDKFMKEE